MPGRDLRPTRIELINTNKRIKLASRGLDLLKMKRSSLVMEFFKISRTVSGMRENLRALVTEAVSSIQVAEILNGSLTIERIANMSADDSSSIKTRNIMGVRIPELKVNFGQSLVSYMYRASSLPVPVNEALKKFQQVFNMLIEVAEKESSMRKLLHEIDKTKRRSNAIENVLIPELKDEAKYIRMRLDEMERDTFTTLKTIKRKMESQRVET
ncbi:MAG: V-type ATP synthase subunit D [Candidatus Thermoplasmatota archaeon]|jgi:V/A-type H+-transporting ATPase subunit D|nr:V-type ATP synthase subunit D [Candidatus Thermoplasmatota archaeon]